SNANKALHEVFSGQYALPANGPEKEKKLSYYYIRDSALCIGLDQYESRSGHSINQPWLDQVLKHFKKPFVFVYGHEPAFMSGNHEVNDTLGANSLQRDAMWES